MHHETMAVPAVDLAVLQSGWFAHTPNLGNQGIQPGTHLQTQLDSLVRAYRDHWQEWHTVRKPDQAWLASWLDRIPHGCGRCGPGFRAWVDANPPRFDDWFAYSVEGHNWVNTNLPIPKPALTIDEALGVWFPKWELVTLADLAAATVELASKLPPIRGVAGVPVSGQLVAPILSTLLHVPLWEASYEFGLRRCAHGYRGATRHVDESLPMLIVDDTISSGRSLGDVRNRLSAESNLLWAVALANPKVAQLVDFFGRECAEPHLLEWNLANTGYIRTLGYPYGSPGAGIMLDFDGVLCLDPTHFDEATDSGRAAYMAWIESAPLGSFVPRMQSIPSIVSYRCEYTRQASESWLRRHGIQFDRLHLWGNPSDSPAGQASSRSWRAADWKGRLFRDSDCGLFVESDRRQAQDIAAVAGKPVVCWDSRELIWPNG